ncbi:MAG: M56 family metallopeptidase [Planctomycetota bacterium]|nr:M56 family metallopeptidase [Planctomycetota bacterium]
MTDPVSTTLDQFAQRWGAWMFGISWQLVVVVGVVWGVTWLARNRSATLVHALWLLVLVRLLIPPSFASPTGWGWWVLPADQSTAPSTASSVAVNVPPAVGAFPEFPNGHNPNSAGGLPSIPGSTPDAVNPDESTSRRPQAVSRWLSYLMLAWAGVALSMLVLLAVGSVRVWMWVQTAEPIDDPDLYALLRDCQRRVGFNRPVELRNSEACTTPVVVGQFRPTILLPRAVLGELTLDELRGVLLHELHHLRRADAIVNFAQGILTALYFFHPLVWWANSRIREWRELACDESTLLSMPGGRRAYGGAIVKVTEIFGYASPPLALGVMESKGPTRKRLERILSTNPRSPALPRWQVAFGCLVLGAVLLPGAGATRSGPSTALALESPAASDPSGRDRPGNDTPPGPASMVPRYRWRIGDSLTYSVSIEVDVANNPQTLSGAPVWRVVDSDALGTRLACDGELTARQRPRRIEPGRLPFSFSPSYEQYGRAPFEDSPTLEVDGRGVVHRTTGDSNLPWLLGSLSELVIVPLPADSVSRWTVNSEPKVALSIDSPDNGFGLPSRRSALGPLRSRPTMQMIDGRMNAVYSLGKRSKDSVEIERVTTLVSREPGGGTPQMKLEGQTIFTFDLARGVVGAVSGRWKFTKLEGGSETVVPIRLTAKLVTNTDPAASPTEP